jgi:hypothetical protein
MGGQKSPGWYKIATNKSCSYQKFALSPFVGLSESHLVDLANDLLVHKVSLCNHPIGGGDSHIKTMSKWSIV